MIEMWLTGAGSPVVNNDNGRGTGTTDQAAFDNDTTRQLYTWIDDMKKDGLLTVIPDTPGQIDQYLAMAQGKASMTIETSTAATSVEAFLGGTLDPGSVGAGTIDPVDPNALDLGAAEVPGINAAGQAGRWRRRLVHHQHHQARGPGRGLGLHEVLQLARLAGHLEHPGVVPALPERRRARTPGSRPTGRPPCRAGGWPSPTASCSTASTPSSRARSWGPTSSSVPPSVIRSTPWCSTGTAPADAISHGRDDHHGRARAVQPRELLSAATRLRGVSMTRSPASTARPRHPPAPRRSPRRWPSCWLAAACGGGGGSSQTSDTTGALPDCPVHALDNVTSPVELVVWHTQQAKPLDTLQALAAKYNASQNKVQGPPRRPGHRLSRAHAQVPVGRALQAAAGPGDVRRHRHPDPGRLQRDPARPGVHQRRQLRHERLPAGGPQLLHDQQRAVAGVGQPGQRPCSTTTRASSRRPDSTRTSLRRPWPRCATPPRRSTTAPAWPSRSCRRCRRGRPSSG